MQENKIIFEGYKQVKEITSGCYGCAFVDKTNMCIKRIAVYCTETIAYLLKKIKNVVKTHGKQLATTSKITTKEKIATVTIW